MMRSGSSPCCCGRNAHDSASLGLRLWGATTCVLSMVIAVIMLSLFDIAVGVISGLVGLAVLLEWRVARLEDQIKVMCAKPCEEDHYGSD